MTNKELVLKFYDEVFNNWDISNLDNYMKDNTSSTIRLLRAEKKAL